MTNNGHFRPHFCVMYPYEIQPNKLPKANNDANHEASSIVIFPDGNGVSSDVSKTIVGDDQLLPIKTPIANTLTV